MQNVKDHQTIKDHQTSENNARASRLLPLSPELKNALDELLDHGKSPQLLPRSKGLDDDRLREAPTARKALRQMMPTQDPPFDFPWSVAAGSLAVVLAAAVICFMGWMIIYQLEVFLPAVCPTSPAGVAQVTSGVQSLLHPPAEVRGTVISCFEHFERTSKI